MMILKGIAASQGNAIGRAFIFKEELKTEQIRIEENQIVGELERFEKAVRASKEQLKEIEEKVAKEIGDWEAKVFRAQRLILEDYAFLTEVKSKIQSEKINVEAALQEVVKKFVARFEQEAFSARIVADVQDVGKRVLRNLLGVEQISLATLEEPVIVIARLLTPSDTAYMKREKILGFATDIGGVTSHVAIIAREYRIPAVVGLGDITQKVHSGDTVIIDGNNGIVIANPDEETINRLIY